MAEETLADGSIVVLVKLDPVAARIARELGRGDVVAGLRVVLYQAYRQKQQPARAVYRGGGWRR